MAQERSGAVTMRGNPMTLIGPELKPGDVAPEATLLNGSLAETPIRSPDKVRIVSVVPSLDTPVCDIQTKRFNQEAGALGDEIEIVTVSADLPFAQGRWCSANSCDRVICLSDHREMAFGNAYGVHVKELRLDARAVFVIDKQGRIAHAEYVKEISEQLDYGAALKAARTAAAV